MKIFLHIICTVILLNHHFIHAKTLTSEKQRPIMLELYTSQGCSGCPPAESWINSLKTDPRLWKTLIPINFHVDYWDYLGWPDPFANNAFNQRQRNYKQQGHSRYVATPGFIVDGKGWNGWFAKQAIPMNQQTSPAKLEVNLDNMIADVTFMSTQFNSQPMTMTLAILGFDQNTLIKRGENKGETLKHDFVVLKHIQVTVNPENFSYKTKLPLPDTSEFNSAQRAIVIWVSHKKDPRPIQVVADWL